MRHSLVLSIFLNPHSTSLQLNGVGVAGRSATEGMTLRLADGSAKDFLWGVEANPELLASTKPNASIASVQEFVRQLVHATFKDGRCVCSVAS